ncbi:MAG TPA: hypothetical protein DER52_09720 [Glaciecola sp.]|nr:hypothetical protein [Glaciecola sp.]
MLYHSTFQMITQSLLNFVVKLQLKFVINVKKYLKTCFLIRFYVMNYKNKRILSKKSSVRIGLP